MTRHPYPDVAKLVLAQRAPAEVADEVTRTFRADGTCGSHDR